VLLVKQLNTSANVTKVMPVPQDLLVLLERPVRMALQARVDPTELRAEMALIPQWPCPLMAAVVCVLLAHEVHLANKVHLETMALMVSREHLVGMLCLEIPDLLDHPVHLARQENPVNLAHLEKLVHLEPLVSRVHLDLPVTPAQQDHPARLVPMEFQAKVEGKDNQDLRDHLEKMELPESLDNLDLRETPVHQVKMLATVLVLHEAHSRPRNPRNCKHPDQTAKDRLMTSS
jgi:hypothetical protein